SRRPVRADARVPDAARFGFELDVPVGGMVSDQLRLHRGQVQLAAQRGCCVTRGTLAVEYRSQLAVGDLSGQGNVGHRTGSLLPAQRLADAVSPRCDAYGHLGSARSGTATWRHARGTAGVATARALHDCAGLPRSNGGPAAMPQRWR